MSIEAQLAADEIDSLVAPRIVAAVAELAKGDDGLLDSIARKSGLHVDRVRAAFSRARRNASLAELMAAIGGVVVDIPESAWEVKDESEENSDLHCSILINGVLHHITALRVERKAADGGYSMLEAVGPCTEDLSAMSQLDPEANFRTTTIGGKEYVLYVIPGDD